jgi:hypothetical protein
MVFKRHGLAFICFLGIAALGMYWLLFNLPDHMPADRVTDYYHFHWNFWWVRHVLTTPGLNIYETNFIFAPATSSLALHTLTLFWYPVWALFEPVGGTFVAMTLTSMIAFALNGYLFFVLLRREKVSYALALVGGAMLELSPIMFAAFRWTNMNLYGWFWIPVLILIWGLVSDGVEFRQRSFRRHALFWAFWMGVAIWGMVLTDVQYPLLICCILIPYGLLKLWQMPIWSLRLRLLGFGIFGAGLGLALLWFVGPLPYLINYDRTGLASTAVEHAVKVPFPLGFIWHYKPNLDTPIGAVAIPLVLVALWLSYRARKWSDIHLPKMRWFWLALTPIPLILSAGGFIMIGDTQITMPYVWLHNLFGGTFRYPQRFSPVFLIAAVLFAMMTISPILARRKKLTRILIPTILLFIVIIDSWMLDPTVIQPTPKQYHFYEEMGKEPYDYVVLEVPTGGSSGEGAVGEDTASALEFYGTIHGKRMVNGHISRVNTYKYYYMRTDDAMMAWLGQRVFLDPEKVTEQLTERIQSWPIGYIVIHRDLIWRDGPTTQEILGYFNSLPNLVCPVWVEGDVVVYRTIWHPAGCPPRTPPETAPGQYTIDIGAPEDAPYIGWGWHWAEEIVPGLMARWTGEYPDTKLYIDLPPAAYQVKIAAQSFYRPRDLELLVNGVSVGEVNISETSLSNYTFAVPVEVIGNGKNLIFTLFYDSTDTPTSVGAGDSDRRLAILIDQIQFTQVANES